MLACTLFFFCFAYRLLEDGDVYLYDGAMSNLHTDVFKAPYTGDAAIRGERTALRNSDRWRTMNPALKLKYYEYWEKQSEQARERSRKISNDRKIVEHYFARLKLFFPILKRMWSVKRSLVDKLFRVCLMYTNIIHLFVHPLRSVPCTPSRRCFYCTHIASNPGWARAEDCWLDEYKLPWDEDYSDSSSEQYTETSTDDDIRMRDRSRGYQALIQGASADPWDDLLPPVSPDSVEIPRSESVSLDVHTYTELYDREVSPEFRHLFEMLE